MDIFLNTRTIKHTGLCQASEICPTFTPALSYMLWIIVVLKQTLKFNLLFSLRASVYLATLIYPTFLTSLPLHTTEKHPHSMMLSPPSFLVEMVLASKAVPAACFL